MKTIQKQTLWGTLISFAGVFFGTINQGYLMPKYLQTDQIGLISILISYSVILQIIGPLGFHYAGSKYFPKFENPKEGHNGFLFIGLLFVLVGITIGAFFLFFFEDWIVGTQIESSKLFKDYFYFLYPLLICNSFFSIFDNYAKNLQDTVFGIFLNQLFNRIGAFIVTVLVIIGYLNFEQFIQLWVVSQCLPAILIFLYILFIPGSSFKPTAFFFKGGFRKDFISLAMWSLLTGLGTVAIFKLDSILVYMYLGLSQIGIYNFCLLFGSVMSISYNINVKTTTSFIIKSIHNEDWEKVKVIYQKSSLTQTIFGFGILILAFSNLEILFSLINKKEFDVAIWAILIIGYTKIVDLMTGINSLILLYSKYYRWDIYLNLIFVLIIVVLNAVLIPYFGINGAAFSLFLATVFYNFLRVAFLYKKFQIIPFKSQLLEVLLVGSIMIFIGFYLPDFKESILLKLITITYKSVVLGSVFSFIVIKRNYSTDFNELFFKGVSYLNDLFKAK